MPRLCALLAVLASIAACSRDEAESRPAAQPPAASALTSPAPAPIAPQMQFAPRSVPQNPVGSTAAAANAEAPRLALRLIGMATIGNRRMATFTDGNTVYTAGNGDSLGNDWQLVSIDDEKTVFYHRPSGRKWEWSTAQIRGDTGMTTTPVAGAAPSAPPAAPPQAPASAPPGIAQLPPDAPPSLFRPMSPANPTVPLGTAPPQGIGMAPPAQVIPPQGLNPVYPTQVTPQGAAPKPGNSRP